jgi:hypothetical protein
MQGDAPRARTGYTAHGARDRIGYIVQFGIEKYPFRSRIQHLLHNLYPRRQQEFQSHFENADVIPELAHQLDGALSTIDIQCANDTIFSLQRLLLSFPVDPSVTILV